MMSSFGFIGTGNMGAALACAAAKSVAPSDLFLANRTAEKAQALAKTLGCSVVSNEEIATRCKYIFLGVKPQMMGDLLKLLQPVLKRRTDRFLLVTMAAGLSCARIAQMAGGDYPVIRIMPNTPVAIGKGMILYAQNEAVYADERAEFFAALSAAGIMDELPEHLIDAGSAVSGCGPAFLDLFIEALADGGVECGLPRAKAQLYAAQMAAGAADLVVQSGEHPGVLKDRVCSPGGSTIVGVHALEDGGFRSLSMDAVCAAFEKTKALGK